VAGALTERLAAISDDVQRVIEREIPALRDDQRVVGMLEASVAENITTIVHALRYGLDVSAVEPPTSAIEYARRLAQRDVDAAALVRAYRIGQARFIRLFMEELHDQTGADEIHGATTMRAVEQVSEYIDQVVGRLLPVYEQERTGWLQNRSAVLASRVRAVLEGGPVDVDRVQQALGYQLRQHHVGLVLWIDGHLTDLDPLRVLGELAEASARAVGSADRPLFVLCDDTTAWACTSERRRARAFRVGGRGGEGAGSRVDGGGRRWSWGGRVPPDAPPGAQRPRRGGDRWGRSHAADPVQRGGTDRAHVRRRRLAAGVGGRDPRIALTSERNDGLRDTARVFLQSGGSYTATADQLFLHRNTVQYRIRQAEELRGRPFADGRLDVELALLACHWLGPAVLQPA